MKIYLVGGAVRDMLLKKTPHDKDFVVFGATISEMLEAGYLQVGSRFPVFLHPESKHEYALARKEEKIGDKHTDFKFVFTPDVTINEDIMRRDFTCNALLYDEENQSLTDLVGGKKDIENKILRHICAKHFVEDPLRVLRMCRFKAKLDFNIAPETMALAQKMVRKGMLEHLTPERIWKEISEALQQPRFAQFILTMRKCGALKVILPEINKLWQTPQCLNTLKKNDNLGEHIVSALEHAENLSAKAKFALLLLNTGNIKEICSRLKVPNQYRDLALTAAKQHTNMQNVPDMNSERLLFLLIDVCALKDRQRLADYIKICRADMLGYKRGVTSLERARFRLSAMRLITNFKIQSRIKATDMANFEQLVKDRTFAERFFRYRCEKII